MTNQKIKFEIGKTYEGINGVGSCAITIVRRTEKSVWVNTVLHTNKRLKINNYCNHAESISYLGWLAGAEKTYSESKQIEDSYRTAYYS